MSQATSMPVQYKRLYKGLLDADGTFETLDDAKAYAAGPTGCPGHVIGVLINGARESYIVEEDGSLARIAKYSEVERYLTPSWETIDSVTPPPDDSIKITMKNGKQLITKNGNNLIIRQ